MSKKFFKYFLALALFAGLFLTGCDKNKDKGSTGLDPFEVGSLSNIDLQRIMDTSYSDLEPDEQKVKLENQTIEFLNELKAAGSLQAIDVFEYFINLVEDYEIDIDDPGVETEKPKFTSTFVDQIGRASCRERV